MFILRKSLTTLGIIFGEHVKDHDGNMYVLDAVLERKGPDAQIEAAYQLYQQWRFTRMVVESNSFQSLLVDSYHRRFKDLVQGPKIQALTQSGNKEIRIANLDPYIANGILRFNRRLSKVFIDQLAYFPTATHDDGPDALQGAVQLLLTRVGRQQETVRRNPERRTIVRATRPDGPT